MIIKNINDLMKLEYIFEILLNIEDIKAINMDIDSQNNIPYIYFDIDLFDLNLNLKNTNKSKIIVIWNNCSIINYKTNNIYKNNYIEHLGLNPNIKLKGPIKYQYIKDIYNYFDGPNNITFDDDNVFFNFGNTLLNILEKIYYELKKEEEIKRMKKLNKNNTF